jgi:mRNA interferase MazF
MPTFETWDIVRVPFPYTDRPIRQRRPALVIASGELLAVHRLLWLAMITSAEHSGRLVMLPSLISIARGCRLHRLSGRQRSRRSKRAMRGRLGTLPPRDRPAVRTYLQQRLADLG